VADRYRIPAAEHRAEQEVSRSRFLTTLAPAPEPTDAHALVARLRAEYPEATHHCWAFVAGPPGSTARVGMSDAGEPHGTAGRPMLTALLHSGVGDVAAVVTRWYGGTKLGTGGLARAYARGVVAALATLRTVERVTWARLRLTFGYDVVTAVQQLAAAHGARVADEAYAADVTYAVDVPASSADALAAAVRDATRGRAAVERDDA
jgi:uncharacterized YigZ family protein